MITVVLHMLRRSRGAILGWGLSLGILGFYMMLFYDTLADQKAMLEHLIASYPPELMAFFGGGENIFSPYGIPFDGVLLHHAGGSWYLRHHGRQWPAG